MIMSLLEGLHESAGNVQWIKWEKKTKRLIEGSHVVSTLRDQMAEEAKTINKSYKVKRQWMDDVTTWVAAMLTVRNVQDER